jgi:hypothetical protein
MNNSFWFDVLANFISDFIVGIIFGAVLAWWIGRSLSASERSQQRRDEKRSELEKAVRYLELLREEVDYLLTHLPDPLGAPQPYEGPEKIRIPTPFWDSLQPSGELPRLLNPQLLAALTQFYDHLMYAKQGKDWLMTRLVNSNVAEIHSLTQNEIENVIRLGLEKAYELRRSLPDKLVSEIHALNARLDSQR